MKQLRAKILLSTMLLFLCESAQAAEKWLDQKSDSEPRHTLSGAGNSWRNWPEQEDSITRLTRKIRQSDVSRAQLDELIRAELSQICKRLNHCEANSHDNSNIPELYTHATELIKSEETRALTTLNTKELLAIDQRITSAKKELSNLGRLQKILDVYTGWTLEQKFSGFQFQGFGNKSSSAVIDLKPDKFHLAWKDSPAQILVAAPDFKVRTWNDWHSDATYFYDFEKRVLGKSTDHFLQGLTFERGEVGEIAGLKATEFFSVPTAKTALDTKYDTKQFSVRAWLADDIHIANQLSRLFHMLYGAPDLKRFPLSIEIKNDHGKVVRKIETVSAEAAVLKPAQFSAPSHLKPGKVYQPSLFLDKPL